MLASAKYLLHTLTMESRHAGVVRLSTPECKVWETVSTCESAAAGFLPLEKASPSVACLRPPLPAPAADPVEYPHSSEKLPCQHVHPGTATN